MEDLLLSKCVFLRAIDCQSGLGESLGVSSKVLVVCWLGPVFISLVISSTLKWAIHK